MYIYLEVGYKGTLTLDATKIMCMNNKHTIKLYHMLSNKQITSFIKTLNVIITNSIFKNKDTLFLGGNDRKQVHL